MVNEFWKDIQGYEGLYQVSTCGRVKSLPRVKQGKHNLLGVKTEYLKSGGLLKQSNDKNGYKLLALSKDGAMKFFRVHRLVAETFVPNPGEKPIAHHIDGCVSNNNAENLQWVTDRENLYASDVFGQLAAIYGKKINQYDLKGNIVAEYPSMQECSRRLGLDVRHISAVANGKRKRTRGYIFKAVSAND